MNNHRLLTVLLVVTLVSGMVRTTAQSPVVVTLDSLFRIAEANSVQLRPSFAAEREAELGIAQARTHRLPDISTSLALSYIGDGFTTKRDFTDYQKAPIPHFGNTFTVNIEQPVYTGGAITSGIKLAELKLTSSRYETEMKRNDIRFRLTGFYLDIYKYMNLRSVVEKNIDYARKVLADMHIRYDQGTILRNDITRYELLVSNLELELIKTDNILDILNDNLSTISGMPPETVILPDTTILTRALPISNEVAWQSTADTSSPVLKLARSRVDICRKNEDVVRADRLPKVGIHAEWSTNGPVLVEVPPINRNLSYWYVGVGISYNLSSLFKTDKSIARNQAATTLAVDNLSATRESIEMAIRADYIRYIEAYEELKTQKKSVELANRNYDTVSARYSADMALITDLLDAANAKLDAERQLVNAQINIVYYYYKLLFTSGTI